MTMQITFEFKNIAAHAAHEGEVSKNLNITYKKSWYSRRVRAREVRIPKWGVRIPEWGVRVLIALI